LDTWVYLTTYFNKIYKKVRPIIYKKISLDLKQDYLYYEQNISNHLRSGIPYALGKLCNIPEQKILEICAFSEFNYCISLIADDVVDQDEYRWNNFTLHKLKDISYSISYYEFARADINLKFKSISPYLRDYHDYCLWKSFYIEQKLKFKKSKNILADIFKVSMFKTTSGVFGNLMICDLVKDKYPELMRSVFLYSFYLGIGGQIKDDLTDISKHKSYQMYARNSDSKNKYINLVSLGYNKLELLKIIKVLSNLADEELNNILKQLDISKLRKYSKYINYLRIWNQINYIRAKEVI
jgi:geranylgeranyl pyrophosphate synthase